MQLDSFKCIQYNRYCKFTYCMYSKGMKRLGVRLSEDWLALLRTYHFLRLHCVQRAMLHNADILCWQLTAMVCCHPEQLECTRRAIVYHNSSQMKQSRQCSLSSNYLVYIEEVAIGLASVLTGFSCCSHSGIVCTVLALNQSISQSSVVVCQIYVCLIALW